MILFCSTWIPFLGFCTHSQLLGLYTHSCILLWNLLSNAVNCMPKVTSPPRGGPWWITAGDKSPGFFTLIMGSWKETSQFQNSLWDPLNLLSQPHCN